MIFNLEEFICSFKKLDSFFILSDAMYLLLLAFFDGEKLC